MAKKTCILFCALLSFIILTSGCQTTKGVACGVAVGVQKDAQDLWSAIVKTDNWMKENLW